MDYPADDSMADDISLPMIETENYRPPDDFICRRCGRCCTVLTGGYNFTVDEEQIEIWEEYVPQVLDWLVPLAGDGLYDGWISPATGEEVTRCPWLRMRQHERFKIKGAYCLIHEYKSPVCVGYPHTIAHAIRTGCPGFDHLDEAAKLKLLRRNLIILLQTYLDEGFKEAQTF